MCLHCQLFLFLRLVIKLSRRVSTLPNVLVLEFDDEAEHYNGFFGKSFGQAWGWFKERKRAQSVALHAFLTYVTLPWHRIIAGKLQGEVTLSTQVEQLIEAFLSSPRESLAAKENIHV